MMPLFLPKRGDMDHNTALQSIAIAKRELYLKSCDELEERAEEMSKDCCLNPTKVTKNDVVDLAKDTYSLAVQLFDTKLEQGETLYREEKAIYDLCKNELQKYNNIEAVNSIELPDGNNKSNVLGSIWGALFNAVELVRNCIDQIKYWFNLTTERDKSDRSLINAGHKILPMYASLIEGFFTTIAEFFTLDFVPTLIGISEAQAECALRYQDNNRSVDKQMASRMLDIADYAYSGYSGSEDYQKLSASEIPQSIRSLYDENQGLISSSRGLRVWLGKKDNNIAVSYSGTDIKDIDMVYADIIQLSQPSILYLKAAGLLKILMDNMPGKHFFVAGHSLGGGLTQFSVTANMNDNSHRITGYGYNPAGLSMLSIKHLENSRMTKAVKNIWIFMTCKDPVSAFGGKLGCLTTLPKTEKNGHGMADLKECMRKYLEAPVPIPSKNEAITWRCHADTDFIPYTRTLSFCDSNTVYPVFNSSVSGNKIDLISFEMSDNLFSCLDLATSKQSFCLGVYNKFNGTAHTVMNRMLLLASGQSLITNNSAGNIHSSIIYGKFGLGIPEFIELLRRAYADSGEAVSGSQAAFQELLSHLNNPFEYDKAAWIEGIRIQFGIDMNAMFRQWPLAEPYFDRFIIDITAERIDWYRTFSNDVSPDKDTIKRLLSGIRDIVMTHANILLSEGVRWNVFSQGDMDYYMSEARYFADGVINRV